MDINKRRYQRGLPNYTAIIAVSGDDGIFYDLVNKRDAKEHIRRLQNGGYTASVVKAEAVPSCTMRDFTAGLDKYTEVAYRGGGDFYHTAPDGNDRRLTATQYAALHGRTEREIRRLIKAGRLPYEIDLTNPMKPEYRIDRDTPYPEPAKPGPKPKPKSFVCPKCGWEWFGGATHCPNCNPNQLRLADKPKSRP